MKCTTSQKLIVDSVDGEITGEEANQLKKHMQECAECLSLYNDMNKLVQGAGSLDRIDASRDMWPLVEAGVFEPRREKMPLTTFIDQLKNLISGLFRSHRPLAALVAAATVIIFISIGIQDNASFKIPGETDIQWLDMTHYDAMEVQYHYAIEELSRAIADKKEVTGFEFNDDFRDNLEILNTSISLYREVIKKDPENLDVRHFLIKAYKKKKDLLFKGYLISKL